MAPFSPRLFLFSPFWYQTISNRREGGMDGGRKLVLIEFNSSLKVTGITTPRDGTTLPQSLDPHYGPNDRELPGSKHQTACPWSQPRESGFVPSLLIPGLHFNV